jgi:N-acetylneuraminic acid mutarotase
MPTARSALAAGTYNGRIYVAGGEFQDPKMMATFRAVEAYDPARNAWTTIPSLPVSRHGLAGGMIGSRFYVVGGDVQSSGTGVHVSTAEHDAMDLSVFDK